MRPEILKLLKDMSDAANDVAGFSSGRSLDEFLTDKQFRMAVERGFEIIGEALSQLHKLEPAVAESLTDWRAIIGFRNVLIHGYGQVDHTKTWDILQSELPMLQRELGALLKP
jgi:uncharacterized protein with HEPN domain